VDGVALASVITSGVAVIATSGVAVWTVQQSAKLARKTRVEQRLADSYLEVLRLVEREGQWVEARITNQEIAAAEAENFDSYPSRVKMSEPDVTDRATIAAHLAAFGSDNVRRLYPAWRSTITAIENEETTLSWGAIEDSEAPSFDDLKRLRDVLYPTERAARQAMADAIAEELGHR
jgi:hypothetical protein